MKRILPVLVLVTAFAAAATTMAFASKHAVKQHRAVAVQAMSSAACPVSDPSQCGGSCPRSATAATAAAKGKGTEARLMKNGVACPVSNPSACPASCARQSASTVAANVAGH